MHHGIGNMVWYPPRASDLEPTPLPPPPGDKTWSDLGTWWLLLETYTNLFFLVTYLPRETSGGGNFNTNTYGLQADGMYPTRMLFCYLYIHVRNIPRGNQELCRGYVLRSRLSSYSNYFN